MACKGICVRYRALKPHKAGRYETGQKRCQTCGIFLYWDGLTCPCCGNRLRTKPRSRKKKRRGRGDGGRGRGEMVRRWKEVEVWVKE